MAYKFVKFKDGNVRVLKTGDTIPLGRSEIAHAMFDRYLQKKEMQEYRENANVSTVPRFSGLRPDPRLEEAG